MYRAELRNIRITARKARLVVDLVRGKPVSTALDTLKLTKKKCAPLLSKLISSAMANAKDQATVDVDRLYVAEAYVNEGTTLKRFIPRAQGRATPIRKRSSHIIVKLQEL
jgi:large subunit ribosomal protein L22